MSDLNLDCRVIVPLFVQCGTYLVEIYDRQEGGDLPVCFLRAFADEKESDTIERARQLILVIEEGWRARFGPIEGETE